MLWEVGKLDDVFNIKKDRVLFCNNINTPVFGIASENGSVL